MVLTKSMRIVIYKKAIDLLANGNRLYVCPLLRHEYEKLNHRSIEPNSVLQYFPEFLLQKPDKRNPSYAWWSVENTEARIVALERAIELAAKSLY